MSTSAAIADSLLRRAFGRRARSSGPAASPPRRRPQAWFDFFVEPRTSHVPRRFRDEPSWI